MPSSRRNYCNLLHFLYYNKYYSRKNINLINRNVVDKMRNLDDLGKGLAVAITAIAAAVAVIAVGAGTPVVAWVFAAPCIVAFWAWSIQ